MVNLPLLLADLAVLCGAFATAAWIVFDTWLPWDAPLHGDDSIWSLLALMVVGLLAGTYLSRGMRRVNGRRPGYGHALTVVTAALVITTFGVVITRGYWSRSFLFWTSLVWLLGLLLIRAWLRRRPWVERVMIISHDSHLVADLTESPHLAVVDVRDPAAEAPASITPQTTLAIDLRSAMSDDMVEFVADWSLSGAPVSSIAALYEDHLGRVPIVHIAHGWELSTPVARNDYDSLKRILDIVFVLLMTPLWVPLGMLIWLIIRLDSPGAPIYHQTRIGRHGKRFRLHKFRTMVDNAEEDGPRFAALADPRLTRVGRVLRRFRLDELPQLVNVLLGHLSLVGPRPERPYFAEQFSDAIPLFSYRNLVRPGVTGWAQVNMGYADDVAGTVQKLAFDLYYVKHMSIWLDLEILRRSVWTVLSGFGAR